MTTANNITNILQPYLKIIAKAYIRVFSSNDLDYQKNVYSIGKGGLIFSVRKVDASLTLKVIEEMPLENIEDYLTDRCLPGTWQGFAHKIPEEVRELLEKLCEFLLDPPADGIDAKTLMQKAKEVESDCYRKYHQIPEQTMQSMRFEVERAELNMSLKKG